jgi:hypothetical protein
MLALLQIWLNLHKGALGFMIDFCNRSLDITPGLARHVVFAGSLIEKNSPYVRQLDKKIKGMNQWTS